MSASAESYNSDEERYADDTFEQESDTDVPEVAEIESEISEVSDEENNDRLPTVKENTNSIIRSLNYTNVRSAASKTDAVPFDSSSDEEDDVVVGQTFAEINTPSMNFYGDNENGTPTRREIRPIRRDSSRYLQSLDEQSESSVSEEGEEENSDDEREFQKIQEMEERYLLQNSGKTPKVSKSSISNQKPSNSVEQIIKVNDTSIERTQHESSETNIEDKASTPEIDPIPELIERVMENFTPTTQVSTQFQTDSMEIVQNSLANLQSETQALERSDMSEKEPITQPLSRKDDPIRMTFSFEPNGILNPQNIAMAFLDAMNATSSTFFANTEMSQNFPPLEVREENGNGRESQENGNIVELNEQKNGSFEKNTTEEVEDHQHGDKEVELEQLGSTSPPPLPDVEDTESYYDTQFEYQITSKTPSCFNSEDYVFHANFIRPTPSTDRLRAKPHPRKSMSFSNERMREIERHNQILLRKILTQKPTYISKSAQHKMSSNNNSQTNARLTTSALNRKKQQRQIDLDNQVLKRKIEAIALRRRPLIS